MCEVALSQSSKTKRKRICLAQSKNGCFTCKVRRVKCDETHPQCLRCLQSERTCRGYGERSISRSATRRDDDICNLQAASIDVFQQQLLNPSSTVISSQQQWTKLGLSLLARDASARFGAAGLPLTTLLFQLSHTTSYINRCAYALGIVYKTQCKSQRDVELESSAAFAYHSSLRHVRKELQSEPSGSVPLIFACLFLVAVETLLGQPRKAILHLRAAHAMLAHSSSPLCGRGIALDQITPSPAQNDLQKVFRSLDVHISSFIWDYTTSLTTIRIYKVPITFSELDTASNILFQILAACSVWVADVFRIKYSPAMHNTDLLVEQGRHILALSMWLEQFSIKYPSLQGNSDESSDAVHEHALNLRMTCMSWLIRLYHLLAMHETAYDIQASRFERIVIDAEQVASIRERRRVLNQQTSAKEQCVLGTGMIEPLFLVATKYRHAQWRRRAIACLNNSGLELPFSGRREAAIAQYTLDYEVVHSQREPALDDLHAKTKASGEQESHHSPFGIPEADRIHGCRIPEDGFMDGKDKVMVTFVRCNDVEAVPSCTNCQSDYDSMFVQECHWTTWKEEIRWQ